METNWLAIIIAILLLALLIYGIFKQVEEYQLQDDPMLHKIREHLKPLFSADNYYTGVLSPLNDENILDRVKLYKGNKSYTINKEKIFLCLKDENDEYYDLQQLYFVILHELAHCICQEIGHTEKFHEIFEALLLLAAEKGLYDPNYKIDENYCKHGSDE